jgi:hypothetical protein
MTMHPSSRPVAWALLSQSIWLPLLAIDLHDRWHIGQQSMLPPVANSPSPIPSGPGPIAGLNELSPLPGMAAQAGSSGRDGLASTGLLLGAGSQAFSGAAETNRSAVEPPAYGSIALPAAVSGASLFAAGSPRPSLALAMTSVSKPVDALAGLRQSYTQAELLGGPITLADLNRKAPIPPLALAEQGRHALSADPFASLPEGWREPMRRALQALPAPDGSTPRVVNARHVHIPSRRIASATEVPLALQSDGSIDILSRPKEPAVIEEIRDWSAGQRPPSAGSVSPAVVHLHPVSEEIPLQPSAADLGEEAAPPAMAVPAPSEAAPVAEAIPLDALGGEQP